MTISVEIPDSVSAPLQRLGDLSRRALEALALETYRAGAISAREVGEMLGFQSRWQTDEFLKAHGVCMPESAEDIEREVSAVKALLGRE